MTEEQRIREQRRLWNAICAIGLIYIIFIGSMFL